MSSSPLSDSTANSAAEQPGASTMLLRSPPKTFAQFAVITVLSLFIAVFAVPQYIDGWPWAAPLKLPAASRTALQTIPESGLVLDGWKTVEQSAIQLGNDTWSVQQLTSTDSSPTEADAPLSSSVILLLRPQVYGADQPEVEWLDVRGSQRWKTDAYQTLNFELADTNKNDPINITADLFRAWNPAQTYAIVQWYAWPTGGHPSPGRWFWADKKMQWKRNQRLPWVAISLWIPVEPFSDIASQQTLAKSVGEAIQRSLMQTVFLGNGSSH